MIKYKKRYKYKYTLAEDYQIQTNLRPKGNIITAYITLNESGILLIKKGYAWDGPSGPTIDTANFMRGSLVHDALYQLIRGRYIPMESRKMADKILNEICINAGMSRIRAWGVYKAVRIFGKWAARTDIRQAP